MVPMRTVSARLLMLLLVVSSPTFYGCVVPGPVVVTNDTPLGPGQGGGPPPWAPAHGYRAKYRYHYYPDAAVYLDVSRGVYFYLHNGRWASAPSLPKALAPGLGTYVVLEMDTDRPYEFHKDVVKRYPPGQSKKQGKSRGSGKPFE
uniref:Uncharacterized protein n=1 Tax=Desulfacinum infernum TaxID=35837 RepID=A0A832EIR3_9BACT